MPISPYVVRLRAQVGNELLLLPSATVLVIDDDRRLLLARNVGFDRWSTVGGMVEPEEHPRQAAVREVREETGLDVELTALLTTTGGPAYTVAYPNGDLVSYVSSVFSARVIGGTLEVEEEELSAVRWFTTAELQTLDLDRFAIAVLTEVGMLAADAPRRG